MSRARRRYAPKLEAELLRQGAGSTSIAGGMSGAQDGARVSGASVFESRRTDQGTPLTITLCDGSQFTFSRLADIRIAADA
jgi:hypothetical protein